MLITIPMIEIKNRVFHLFWKKFSLLFMNEINRDINKKIPPMGNAEGRKNIPIKKQLFPILKWSKGMGLKLNFLLNILSRKICEAYML